jgi:RimJ/RimL family protein N-acetyltransferase
MSWGPNTREETAAFLGTVTAGRDFAYVLRETGEVIGSGGIYPDEAGYSAEVGWTIHKDHWRQGIGTEAAGELIRYGFEDLGLGRISSSCVDDNVGSWRIMERNGMRREGLLRRAFWARVDKAWVDQALYGILADDYVEPRSSQS